MAAPSTALEIDNMALNRVGAKVITAAQLAADTEVSPKYCNLHYDQTRRALLRSHWWRFARAREELSTTTTPDFEWDYAFDLPSDFLRLISVYENNTTASQNTLYSYKLEGSLLLSDQSSCYLRYVKDEETVSNFDPLFIEVLVLQLALKFTYPIAGTGSTGQRLATEIKQELYGRNGLMSRARVLDRQEMNTIGRADRKTWNDARVSNDSRIDSQMGS